MNCFGISRDQRWATPLQTGRRMREEIVGGRFVRADSGWIDLGTGRNVTLRIIPAEARGDELAWNTRCATLANLRHPLLNPLVGYGTLDNHRRFECYDVSAPIR